MTPLIREVESGTYTGRTEREHPHNGYWAGDFTTGLDPVYLPQWFAWGRAESARVITTFSQANVHE